MIERTAIREKPNPWKVAQAQFDRAATYLNLQHGLRNLRTAACIRVIWHVAKGLRDVFSGIDPQVATCR